MTKTYLLRNIPANLWRECKTRVAQEETNLRAVILAALERYVNNPNRRGKK